MATFVEDGDPGCTADNWGRKQPYAAGPSADPATFDPAQLDFGNWADSFDALGVRNAVMTAKHGCGFLLWPTKSTLPDGSPFKYHTQTDILAEFVDAAKAHGVSCWHLAGLHSSKSASNNRAHRWGTGSTTPS